MLGFRLPFARRKGYGMGASGGGNEGAAAVAASGLLTSLISYWTLDEASGTRVDSVTSSANDLTDNNTVTQNPGKISNAAQFTAANLEFLSRADNASLSTGDIDFTLAGWVYLDSLGAFRVAVGKRENATNREYWFEVNNSDQMRFIVSSNGALQDGVVTASSVTLSTGTWYFVVAWHDSVANTVNIQVNNGTAHSAAFSLGVFDGGSRFAIGVGESSNYWNGRIDEVGFWKRVLTAAERTNLYNAGTGVTYPFTGVP